MKTEKLVIETKIELDVSDVESLIVSAIEGGSNYWYRIESSTKGDYLKQAFTEEGLVISNYSAGEETLTSGKLNAKSIRKALKLMAEKQPNHFADVSNGNADATTGDVFLQLAILGDVIYG